MLMDGRSQTEILDKLQVCFEEQKQIKLKQIDLIHKKANFSKATIT